ncbi:hypothetical protein EDB83DRAFT_2398520 [Lactarius deliciosus]|nr:hypothetical protein EDB83DRAFT_2398520 [Lactarius deliciosus]
MLTVFSFLGFSAHIRSSACSLAGIFKRTDVFSEYFSPLHVIYIFILLTMLSLRHSISHVLCSAALYFLCPAAPSPPIGPVKNPATTIKMSMSHYSFVLLRFRYAVSHVTYVCRFASASLLYRRPTEPVKSCNVILHLLCIIIKGSRFNYCANLSTLLVTWLGKHVFPNETNPITRAVIDNIRYVENKLKEPTLKKWQSDSHRASQKSNRHGGPSRRSSLL